MKKKYFGITPGILAVAAGALVVGMFSALAFEVFAFAGPSANPATGNGAIGSDSANEVSIGTSTPASGTALLAVGSTNDLTTYGLNVETANKTPLLLLRDDGAVSIETSTLSAGNTIIGGNLTVGGTLSAASFSGSSTIVAGNVSAGQFGSGTGGGNYSFPGNVYATGNITCGGACGATTSTWNFVIDNATTTNNKTNVMEWSSPQPITLNGFTCHDTVATTSLFFFTPISDTTTTVSSTILSNFSCGTAGQTTGTSITYPAGQVFVVEVTSTVGTPIATPVHITYTIL